METLTTLAVESLRELLLYQVKKKKKKKKLYKRWLAAIFFQLSPWQDTVPCFQSRALPLQHGFCTLPSRLPFPPSFSPAFHGFIRISHKNAPGSLLAVLGAAGRRGCVGAHPHPPGHQRARGQRQPLPPVLQTGSQPSVRGSPPPSASLRCRTVEERAAERTLGIGGQGEGPLDSGGVRGAAFRGKSRGNPGEIRGKSSPPGTGVSSDVLGVVLWAHHGRAFPDHKVFRGGLTGRWEFAASGACSTPLYDIKKHQIRWLHRQLVSGTSISTLNWNKFLPPPSATDARENICSWKFIAFFPVRAPSGCQKAPTGHSLCVCSTGQISELRSMQTSSSPSGRENLFLNTRVFLQDGVLHYLLTGDTYTEEAFDIMLFSLTVNPICCRQILTSWEGQSSKIQ